MKRKLTASLLALVTSTTLMVAAAPAAQAASTRCGSGMWAVFDHANFGGDMFFCTNVNVTPIHPGNDRTSSIVNRMNRRVSFFEHAGFTGGLVYLDASSQISDLRTRSFNDRISSVRVAAR